MAISNTTVLIKRSLTSNVPSSLHQAEQAYSYSSNTLFLGTAGGDGVINIGGYLYTSTLDAATSANIANTLIKRDQYGAFNGRLYGNANTATELYFPQNFSISGTDITASAVLFTGNNAVNLNASLNPVPGLVSGYYGGVTEGTTTFPTIEVAANGRVIAIANTTVLSYFNISDTANSNTVYAGATIEYKGIQGITTLISSGNTLSIGTDNSVLRSNTQVVGPQVINTDLTITGNLIIQGNTTTLDAQHLNISDPIIYLAANNYSSDIVDIGFAGNYYDGANNRHFGLVRHASDKNVYLFDNYLPEPDWANTINILDSSFRLATLYANTNSPSAVINQASITTANVIQDIQVNRNAYINGTAYINSANVAVDLDVVRNIYATGLYSSTLNTTGSASVGGSLTVNQNTTLIGRANLSSDLGVAGNTYLANNLTVTGTSQFIGAVSASSLTLATPLAVPSGGTGQSSFSVGQVIVGNGTGSLQQLANVSSINTTLTSNATVSNLTTDVYGRVLSFTTQQISGLTVPQGGTGQNSFTLNGIIYGNSAGGMLVTAAAGVADQTYSNQILTVTNSGVPVWSSALDGGQF